MTDDTIYRTLEFFKSSGKKIHINIIAGQDKGLWRNGFVLDVSLDQRCFIFIDDVLGERPYMFEDVDSNITIYKEKKKNE